MSEKRCNYKILPGFVEIQKHFIGGAAWMAGTSPAMTARAGDSHLFAFPGDWILGA